MPRRKKPTRDMTTEEAIRALFPKRVVDRVDRELEEEPKKAPKKPEKPAKSRKP